MASRALADYLFCYPGDKNSPVLIGHTGAIMRMSSDEPLHQYLMSGLHTTAIEEETKVVDNTDWVDTTNMPTGRGLKRLMNQCPHSLPRLGFGPRLTVPLTKEQVHKAKKQKRFVSAGKCVPPAVTPQPAQSFTPHACLPYCSCNTTYPEGRRRYTGVRSKEYKAITVSKVCQTAIPAASQTLDTLDKRIAKQKAWKTKSERKPTVSVADKLLSKHSAVEINMKEQRQQVPMHCLRNYVVCHLHQYCS
jgi:hypothetical protein